MFRKVQLPFDEALIRELRIGDSLLLSGTICTGRDNAHKLLAESADIQPAGIPNLQGGVIYHCGPVVVKSGDEWKITAAGPTTSIREEMYMGQIIRRYGLRAIIGKGGMGAETLAAAQECGCVYLHAVGGAAQILARAVKRVRNVYHMEDFGVPEAFWELEVEDFPVTVTMDAVGGNLHDLVAATSEKKLQEILISRSE